MAGKRRSYDSQQTESPPRTGGDFYRDPRQAPQQLEGDSYSQQTGKPSGGKGKFYSRVESDEPEGHFFRDRKTDPPVVDEELAEKVKKRSAKVKRQRGRM